jgi:hypothetical protein
MHAMTHAGAEVGWIEQEEPRRELAPAPAAAAPELFCRVVRRRTHEAAALATVLALVTALLGLGVWMVMDVADALELARACDGKCVEVRR